MADNCWMNLWCRPGDRKIFEEAGFRSEFEEDEFDGKALHLISDYYIDTTALMSGAPFIVTYDPTTNAGVPGSIVSDGKKWMDVEVNDSGLAVVPVQEDGTILDHDLSHVREFILFRQDIRKRLGTKD